MADLPEIEVRIVESHTVYSPYTEPRHFQITTRISGAKSEISALYDRVDAILDAVAESLPATMSDCEAAIHRNNAYATPQLDRLHEMRLKRRPKLPSRYL